MAYLHQIFDNPFARRALERVVLPNWIEDNLKHEIRPYQVEAFKRHLYLEQEEFDGKPRKPLHLLYNMATGSGKTLIMGGLILHLYEKGYRNFLFFVNSNNIIQKTKENFLNPKASKYLFKERVVVNGKDVQIKEVDNFDEADGNNINIKFVSIQMLTSGLLLNIVENGLSFEDFEGRKLVLIGDEAHHNNAEVWGDLILKIHRQNIDNILLEFTATLDYDSQEIVEKYQDKVIYKYDLSQFRHDKYSKEINLIRSLYDEKNRVIQALILNLYRQELATSLDINLKPVILFKAKRYITESQKNKENFHKLIEDLTPHMIEEIKRTSSIPVVENAFGFFEKRGLTLSDVSDRIKSNFRPEYCLSANNDAEAEKNQILLNTLEDANNPIRAVFAVQKLNEGWDVLNLFDIVRLYENRDGRNNRPGKTTISEAQLIGRGARYFPFKLNSAQDPYTRKFDDDEKNDLKILEELFYHTKEDSRYITELKIALRESGAYDDKDRLVKRDLTLKPKFLRTDLYRYGKVFLNEKRQKSYEAIKSLKDLGVSKTNFRHKLSSGIGKMSIVFETGEIKEDDSITLKTNDIALNKFPRHVVRYSLTKYPFFSFNNLTDYFPYLTSMSEFITSKDFLGTMVITFKGPESRLENISNEDYLDAMGGLLQEIEQSIKANSTQYEGSEFFYKSIKDVFKNKPIMVEKDSERARGQEELVEKVDWYAYNANYGTKEEKLFVELFDRTYDELKSKYEEIYLIRNEREVKIYNKEGQAFEPDFLLFCQQKAGENQTYQVFIEPKGAVWAAQDNWKEVFLAELRENQKTFTISNEAYLITAVPFYNYDDENAFKTSLREVLL